MTLNQNVRLGRFGVDNGRMAAWIDLPLLVVVATDLGTAMRCLEVAAESLGLLVEWPDRKRAEKHGVRDAAE